MKFYRCPMCGKFQKQFIEYHFFVQFKRNNILVIN